jgi:hypothetical protein
MIQQRVKHTKQEKVEDDEKSRSAKLLAHSMDPVAKPKARQEELLAPNLQNDSGIAKVHDFKFTFDQPSDGANLNPQNLQTEGSDLDYKTRFLKKVLKIHPDIPNEKLPHKATKVQVSF